MANIPVGGAAASACRLAATGTGRVFLLWLGFPELRAIRRGNSYRGALRGTEPWGRDAKIRESLAPFGHYGRCEPLRIMEAPQPLAVDRAARPNYQPFMSARVNYA